MHIIRLGEGAHHDGVLALFFGHFFSQIGIEVNLTYSGTRRGIDAVGEPTTGLLGYSFGLRGKLRVEKSVNVFSGNTFDRFFLLINPSFTISTAIFTAARAVRLPLRHWSIHRRPCSTVNSRSCIS
jgi:hypothetical protein